MVVPDFQGRVSDDYQPGNDQWRIGVSSIFAWQLGVAPFKDDFWTTSVEPGDVYGNLSGFDVTFTLRYLPGHTLCRPNVCYM